MVFQVRVAWQNFYGAPGVSTFYCSQISTFRPALVTFWTALAQHLPSGVTIAIPAEGDEIDSVSGAIVGSWSEGTAFSIGGFKSQVYSGATGCVINWKTNTIAGRSRIRGRTFVVPLGGDQYAIDGTLEAGPLGDIRGLVETFRAATDGNLMILHRAVGGVGGLAGPVTSANVPDLAAVLRSRRT